NLFLEQPGLIIALLFILIAIKFTVLLGLGRLFGLRGGKGTLFSFALAQGGEFAFVIISFSLQNNVLSVETSGILLIVVALSMALSPLLLLLNEKLVQPAVEAKSNVKETDTFDVTGNKVIIAGYDRFGIVLGRLLMANGFSATILDDNPDNIQVLRKFGIKVYYGDASRFDLLAAAGCEDAKLLIVAMDNEEKGLQIIDHVKKTYPKLKILARSVSKKHGYELIRREITFEHDMLNSSLQLGIEALNQLGFYPYEAHRAAKLFRHHNKLIEKELFQHYQEDEKKYISETHRLSTELENLLKTEQEHSIHESDTAWDNSSRIAERKESL
nr:NAD-binding protein [Bacteroidales bacterium]